MNAANSGRSPGQSSSRGSGSRPQSGGGQQKMFVKAGAAIDRPPVLFRMPSVKSQTDQSAESAAERASTVATPPAASKPATSKPVTNKPVEQPVAETRKLPHGQQVRIDLAELSAPSVSNEEQTPAQPTAAPASGFSLAAQQELAAKRNREQESQSLSDSRSTTERESERNSERGRGERIARGTTTLPPIDDAPAGRGWSELIGSRLIILLVIGAIAAVAFLANQGSNVSPEATLADLEIDTDSPNVAVVPNTNKATESNRAASTTRSAGSGSVINQANVDSANIESTTVSGANKVARSSSGLMAPANSPTANATATAKTSNDSAVTAAKPDFDLNELMASDGKPAANTATAATDTAATKSGVIREKSAELTAADEEAIRKVTESAIQGELASHSNKTTSPQPAPNSVANPAVPSIRATAHPAPITDWTRYLPPANPSYPGQVPSGVPSMNPYNPANMQPGYAPGSNPSGAAMPGGMLNGPMGNDPYQGRGFSGTGNGVDPTYGGYGPAPTFGAGHPQAAPAGYANPQFAPGGMNPGNSAYGPQGNFGNGMIDGGNSSLGAPIPAGVPAGNQPIINYQQQTYGPER